MTEVIENALHNVAQVLQTPVIVVLLLLIALAVIVVGTLVAEFVSEHRHYRVALPEFMNDLNDSPMNKVGSVIVESGLLKRQKRALVVLYNNRSLPPEMRYALAKRLVNDESLYHQRIVGRTDLMAKVAPMIGLMGTLIPLGPGIVALEAGQTDILADALRIAFDTTTAGLLVAALALCVSKVRKNWYAGYLFTLESIMTSLLEKIDNYEAGIEPKPRSSHYRFDLEAENARANAMVQGASGEARHV